MEATALAEGLQELSLAPADSGLSPGWRIVLHRLSSDVSLDLDAFCGPSIVTRRLLTLGLVSKEMHSLVLTDALPALASRLTEDLWAALWATDGTSLRDCFQRICQDPRGCGQDELEAAVGQLAARQKRDGYNNPRTAKDLAEELLSLVALDLPRRVPPNLLLAIWCERQQHFLQKSRRTLLDFSIEFYLPESMLQRFHLRCQPDLGKRDEAASSDSLFVIRSGILKVYGINDAAGWQRLMAERLEALERAEQRDKKEWDKLMNPIRPGSGEDVRRPRTRRRGGRGRLL